MKALTVISGKGGTGKTSLVACFAALAEGAVLADCDVDAPDLALVLEPRVERSEPFVGGKVARVDADRCAACGECVEQCRFGALSLDGPGSDVVAKTALVDHLACEGCGVCAACCPAGAVALEPRVSGQWFVSRTRFGPMVHAQLGVAQENSGKLVALLRKEAKALAVRESRALVICDGAPGIGCPVIASLGGADLVLVVAEPTVSGIHDLRRVVELARHFKVPAMACVNRFDVNEEMASSIERWAEGAGVEVAGRIPYDASVVAAQMRQMSVVEHSDGPASGAIRDVWKRVRARVNHDGGPEEDLAAGIVFPDK